MGVFSGYMQIILYVYNIMICKICGISNESLDYVECEECPTKICSKCDDSTDFMKLDKLAVVRCPVCARIRDMKNQMAEISGDFAHLERPMDHVLLVSEAVKQMVERGEILMESSGPNQNAQSESSSDCAPPSGSCSIMHIE